MYGSLGLLSTPSCVGYLAPFYSKDYAKVIWTCSFSFRFDSFSSSCTNFGLCNSSHAIEKKKKKTQIFSSHAVGPVDGFIALCLILLFDKYDSTRCIFSSWIECCNIHTDIAKLLRVFYSNVFQIV